MSKITITNPIHVKINKIVSEKQIIQNKQKVWQCFTFLQISLTEDSWVLLSLSSFHLLWYVVLVQVYEETLASHRYLVGKGSILIVFSDNCGYYSLNLHQNWANSKILKINSMWNLKFLYSITLNSTGLFSNVNRSVTHAGFHNIPHLSFGKYWFIDLYRSSKCQYFSLHNTPKKHMF